MAVVALISVGSFLGWNATPDVKLVSIGAGEQTLPFQLVVSSVENSVRSPSGDPASQRLLSWAVSQSGQRSWTLAKGSFLDTHKPQTFRVRLGDVFDGGSFGDLRVSTQPFTMSA
jgi:hypothetical protein